MYSDLGVYLRKEDTDGDHQLMDGTYGTSEIDGRHLRQVDRHNRNRYTWWIQIEIHVR